MGVGAIFPGECDEGSIWNIGYGAEAIPAEPNIDYVPGEDYCELCYKVLTEDAWIVSYYRDVMGICCRECAGSMADEYIRLDKHLKEIMDNNK